MGKLSFAGLFHLSWRRVDLVLEQIVSITIYLKSSAHKMMKGTILVLVLPVTWASHGRL